MDNNIIIPSFYKEKKETIIPDFYGPQNNIISPMCGACEECEDYCEWWCEKTSEGCVSYCETYCEAYCEDNCQAQCELYCEGTCLKSCQGCQDICEHDCQGGCQSSCEGEQAVPPPPTPAYINFTNVGPFEATISWGASTGANYYKVYIGGQFQKNVYARSWNIDFLSPDADFFVCVSGYSNTTGESGQRCGTLTTPPYTPPPVRPQNWNWNTSTSSSGNTLYVMPSSKWNQFTDRIALFRIYKEVYIYPFTQVTANTKLTKTIYNQAVHAINEMHSNPKPLALLTTHIKIPEDLVALRVALNNVT